MDTVKAAVRNEGEKYFMEIVFLDEVVQFPISDDNPNKVKIAFNRIIERIRVSEFEIVLDGVQDDLFSQVADEYIAQLNREVTEIRAEMKQLNLLVDAADKPN